VIWVIGQLSGAEVIWQAPEQAGRSGADVKRRFVLPAPVYPHPWVLKPNAWWLGAIELVYNGGLESPVSSLGLGQGSHEEDHGLQQRGKVAGKLTEAVNEWLDPPPFVNRHPKVPR
jgi:hypothetical protein